MLVCDGAAFELEATEPWDYPAVIVARRDGVWRHSAGELEELEE